MNSYLKLGWVNLVNNHWTFIFLWQQCYMPSSNCHVKAPKMHHFNCLVSLEWRIDANSHSWSKLQIVFHAPRNGLAWFTKMVFVNLHNEDHFLTEYIERKWSCLWLSYQRMEEGFVEDYDVDVRNIDNGVVDITNNVVDKCCKQSKT